MHLTAAQIVIGDENNELEPARHARQLEMTASNPVYQGLQYLHGLDVPADFKMIRLRYDLQLSTPNFVLSCF